MIEALGQHDGIRARARAEWMDLLRGSAIVLVIFNHAILFANELPEGAPPSGEIINAVFAPLRMPLMVFLSGLLLARSLSKPAKEYVRGKVRLIVYPYLLWSLIVIGLDAGTDLIDGVALPWGDLLKVFYSPLSHLWFLFYLTIYYALALVTKPLSPLWVSAAALVLCFATPEGTDRFLILLVFFMLGKWASGSQLWATSLRNRLVRVVAAVVALGFVVAALLGTDMRYSAWSAPFVLAGIVVAINIAERIQHHRATAALKAVGRVSIVYYLGHWYGTIIGSQLASRLVDGQPWATVVGGFVGGVALGLVMHLVYARVPLGRALFEMPQRTRRDRP